MARWGPNQSSDARLGLWIHGRGQGEGGMTGYEGDGTCAYGAKTNTVCIVLVRKSG